MCSDSSHYSVVSAVGIIAFDSITLEAVIVLWWTINISEPLQFRPPTTRSGAGAHFKSRINKTLHEWHLMKCTDDLAPPHLVLFDITVNQA